MSKSEGGTKAGMFAYLNKTGIHALSPKEKREAAKKGNQHFLAKWQNPEYKKIHKHRIQLGRLAARLARVKPHIKPNFGFY